MSIDPAVKAVMRKINKKHGEGAVILGSEIIDTLVPTITTGSLSIDAALGGGWATNHWNEIIGRESAGKTMLVLKTIAANQALDPDWMTVWFASEDFHEPYAEMLGVDLDRVILREENAMETVFEECIEFVETRAIDCVVIDSLPALVPIREDDGSMEDFQPGLFALLTGKFFRKSNPSMKRSMTEIERPITGIVVNQWREKIGGYGDPRTTPGGKGKDFFYFQRVAVTRDEWITNTKGERIGQTIRANNEKNKLAPPGRLGYVDAYFSTGLGFRAGDFDLVKDSIAAAIAYGVIEHPDKLHYRFGDKEWAGRPKLEAAIAEDPKLAVKIREAVLGKIHER